MITLLRKIHKIIQLHNYKRKGMIIGERTTIIKSFLDETHPHLIRIGNDCTLTNCTLLTHDASIKRKTGYSKIGCIIIGDNCFIGYGAIIMPNVIVGNNCIVGAGTVVSKDIPDNSIVVGNPCRIIKNTNDYFKMQKNLIENNKDIVFNYNYKKMNKKERVEEFDKVFDKRKGYDL